MTGTATSTGTQEEEIAFAGLGAQARMLATGQLSSRELVELSLRRIEERSDLEAFRCVLSEQALAQADRADERLHSGERLSLLGVPVAIKDDIDLAGQETRFGCPGAFAPRAGDCEAVKRLRAAGAVIVGKTNTPELGQWPFTEGPAFGVTRNPWSLRHTPGGSSGGAAASVAAGLVPGALGSDGAGSVRIPAAWTGLVGIKPQRGRISTWPEPESFNGLTCLGPLTRTVSDAALMLDALSGNVEGDRHRPSPLSAPFAEAIARAPRPLRIALSLRIPYSLAPAELDPAVREATERIASVLEGLGHQIVEADPPYGLIGLTFFPRSTTGLREWAQRVPQQELLDHRTRRNARMGALCRGPALALSRALEAPLRRRMNRVFTQADIVLTPTTAQPPRPVGSLDGLGHWDTDKVVVGACPYAWPWNVLGWPGINVPAGLTPEGLPLGVQLLGPACSEPLLLSAAGQLEQVERWQDRRPPLPA